MKQNYFGLLFTILWYSSKYISTIIAQHYGNCDYFNQIQVGTIYTIRSPNYPSKYAPGTFCRYTFRAPAGNQIVLNCNEVKFPYSDSCSGDRLHVSQSGNPNMTNSDRYCTGPFSTRSYSNQIVIALFSSRYSTGGTFECDLSSILGCDCGRRKQTRIVGGTEATPNEFPNMAAIVSRASKQLICGATIISDYYAMTAAHCVNVPGRFPEQTALLVGDHDYDSGADTPYAAVYEIVTATRHPNYNSAKDIHDIAILSTRQPIVFNPGVGPVCLPFKYRLATFVGRKVEAIGWGTIQFGGPVSTKLLKVFLDVVHLSQCETAFPNRIISSQVCTLTQGKDTCSYDSGGPLLFSDSAGNNLLYQIGITSYGEACATNRPSVSTRVVSYLDWIQANTPNARFCVQ